MTPTLTLALILSAGIVAAATIGHGWLIRTAAHEIGDQLGDLAGACTHLADTVHKAESDVADELAHLVDAIDDHLLTTATRHGARPPERVGHRTP